MKKKRIIHLLYEEENYDPSLKGKIIITIVVIIVFLICFLVIYNESR